MEIGYKSPKTTLQIFDRYPSSKVDWICYVMLLLFRGKKLYDHHYKIGISFFSIIFSYFYIIELWSEDLQRRRWGDSPNFIPVGSERRVEFIWTSPALCLPVHLPVCPSARLSICLTVSTSVSTPIMYVDLQPSRYSNVSRCFLHWVSEDLRVFRYF